MSNTRNLSVCGTLQTAKRDSLSQFGNNALSSTSYLFVNGDLTLTQTSMLVVDAYDTSSSFTSVHCQGIIALAGGITVKLHKGFHPVESTKVTIVSTTNFTGDFTTDVTVQFQTSGWDNPNNCKTHTVVESGNTLSMHFSSCSSSSPPPPVVDNSGKLRTFYIVGAIVALIAVVIGFIAWCQRKMKKRPWDQLRD